MVIGDLRFVARMVDTVKLTTATHTFIVPTVYIVCTCKWKDRAQHPIAIYVTRGLHTLTQPVAALPHINTIRSLLISRYHIYIYSSELYCSFSVTMYVIHGPWIFQHGYDMMDAEQTQTERHRQQDKAAPTPSGNPKQQARAANLPSARCYSCRELHSPTWVSDVTVQVFIFFFHFYFFPSHSIDNFCMKIILKDYTETCVSKLYDKFERKKLYEKSSR